MNELLKCENTKCRATPCGGYRVNICFVQDDGLGQPGMMLQTDLGHGVRLRSWSVTYPSVPGDTEAIVLAISPTEARRTLIEALRAAGDNVTQLEWTEAKEKPILIANLGQVGGPSV